MRRSKREVTRETDRRADSERRPIPGCGRGWEDRVLKGRGDYLTIGDRADVPEFESVLINYHEAPLFKDGGSQSFRN